MINSYFRTVVVRPTSSHSYNSSNPSIKPLQKPNNKHRKYKLLIILLAAASNRALKQYWEYLWSFDRKKSEMLAKMVSLIDKNIAYSLFLSFDCLKLRAGQNKNKETLLKNVMNLLSRFQKYKVKQSFSRLQLNASRTSSNVLNAYFEQRGYKFCRRMHVLVKRHKSDIFNSIAAYAKFVKSYCKVRVIGVIYSRFHRSIKQNVLAKLHRYVNSRKCGPKVDRQMHQLKLQLQDMTVQVENKTESIQRLEDELNQLKVEQTNNSYLKTTQKQKKVGSVKSYSLKKIALYDSKKSIYNDSNDNISVGDMSFGSLLGNLNKSRTGSVNKNDSYCDCNCGQKAKYFKYKNINQSLKKQLQIVKEELEVAKDLNQHFTNEIKQYLGQQGVQGDCQKLEAEYKRIAQQRDQLRQKVFTYQKYIASLKSQFKIKMQELYRKVRKDM